MSKAPAKPLKPVVYVLDDDDGMRKALVALIGTIGYDAVEFARPSDFLREFDSNRPACLLLDVRMPEMSGLDVQRELNKRGAMLPVLLITGHGDVPMAVQAMKNGALEFLQKPFRDQELVDGINRALAKDAENRLILERHAEIQRRQTSLTPREREVMDLVVMGRLNKQVASELGTVEKTVKAHRARVMQKLEVASLAELVRVADKAAIAGSAQRPMPH